MLNNAERPTPPRSLRQRFGMGVFADALIVVSGVELSPVAGPRRLLDHAVNVAQPLGGYAQEARRRLVRRRFVRLLMR